MAINKIIYGVNGEEIVDSEGHVTVYGIDGTSNRVNKVVYGQNVLIDITDTTATADEVLSGYVMYGANGVKITGTAGQAIEAGGGEVDDDTLITGSGYNWIGEDAELVSEVYPVQEFALKDTSFNGWTPSTTAKAIKATANVSTFVADLENYEYMLKWRCEADVVYNSGTTTKAMTNRVSDIICQVILRRPNSLANIGAENYAGNACVTYRNSPLMDYYNASSTHTYAWSASYGIYPAATAATFSSSTSASPTVTIKTPVWNARCSTTYFSTTVANAVDQTNSKFRMQCELYRMKKESPERKILDDLIDLFNNPMTV